MDNEAKILVLDDDESMRMTVMAVLTPEEWKVDQAASAEEALELCKTKSYDVMLVDKNLPGKSGVDFIREIRGQGLDAAVIMITGYASAASAFEMVNLGIDAYIEKPVSDIFEIAKKTEASLEKRRERRADLRARADVKTDPVKEASTDEERSQPVEVATPSEEAFKVFVACPGAYERNWLSRQLAEWGEVESVESSMDLLALLQGGMPDLLILDYDLKDPGVSELLSKVKTWSPDIVCVIILEKPTFKILSKLIDMEISGVIEKPFDKKAVRQELSRLVRISMLPPAPIQ